jgi:Subtilase family/PEP-CTERM motif
MNQRTARGSFAALLLCALTAPAWAINHSVPAIHGDLSRTLLGDGTGVIVGIVDSGVDDTHPALAGLDSLGNSRMVAEANFVPGEGPSADDVYGHGTWVSSAALSSDATYTGMAPDARFVNARVLSNTGGFNGQEQVENGIGFAIENGADVLNLSLNFFAAVSGGTSQLDLMLDWAAFNRGVNCAICVGNISNASGGTPLVRGPGSAYNGITVGRTTADYSRVHTDSANAFTADGRMKPDVVAPGSGLTLANDDWEGAADDWDFNLNGCSFATPHVAGLMAQQLEAGAAHGLSTDPLVVKATTMNSSSKSVLDKQGNAWEPGQPGSATDIGGVYTVTQPIDIHSGAGQIDGLALATQYLAGEMGPGMVDSIGWDLNSVSAGQFVDYVIDPHLVLGSSLTATLTWYRHVTRTDRSFNSSAPNGIIDQYDSFVSQALSDLDLQILRDGTLIAESTSNLDNVEHLNWNIDELAQYTLRVRGAGPFSGSEQFALAWYGTAVPEPASLTMLAIAAIGLLAHRRR